MLEKKQLIRPLCVLISLVVVSCFAFMLHLKNKNQPIIMANQPVESQYDKQPQNNDANSNENIENIKDNATPKANKPSSPYVDLVNGSGQYSKGINSAEENRKSINSQEIDNMIKVIEEKYNIIIMVATEENFSYKGVTVFAPEESRIKKTLSLINSMLDTLPKGLFADFNDRGHKTTFIIVGNCESGAGVSFVNNEQGNYLVIEGNRIILQKTLELSVLSMLSKTIKSEVVAGEVAIDLERYNPKGFSYGEISSKNVISAGNLGGCFINEVSQRTQADDVGETFKAVFASNTANIFKSDYKISAKGKAVIGELAKRYPSLKSY